MVSFSESIQKDSSKWNDCVSEELFSDFSVPIPNVNNNQSKQIHFFSRSRSLTPFFECDEVLLYVNELIHPLASRSSALSSLLFF